MGDQLEARLPAHELVLGGGAPQYERDYREPAYFEKIKAFNADTIPLPADLKIITEKLISLPNIASKQWIYLQYDSMVGTGNTGTNNASDAAVVLAKPTNKGLALTTDCNSRYVFADPYKGAMIAVAEAARNIVCSGGDPLGVTNCLNFGNPYDPEVYFQFVHAIKGMGDACRKFDTPVTGGNVSFYNQGPDGPVYPTPTIGMVGLLDNIQNKMSLGFKNEGDHIYLIGKSVNDISSSEYLHKILGVEFSPAPYFDLQEEFNMQQAVKWLIEKRLIQSAHDISEGGLMVCLMESAFDRRLGFDVTSSDNIRPDAWWFGEAQGRVVVSVSPAQREAFILRMQEAFVPYQLIGMVTSGDILVDRSHWGSISAWKDQYEQAIGRSLRGESGLHAMDPV
jgi:phosphoribosylformylglycinamidine synthase